MKQSYAQIGHFARNEKELNMKLSKYLFTFLIFFILQLIVYNFLKTGTNVTTLDIFGVSIVMIILLYLWDLLFLCRNKNK